MATLTVQFTEKIMPSWIKPHWFQFRLSSVLWLMALVSVVAWGVRKDEEPASFDERKLDMAIGEINFERAPLIEVIDFLAKSGDFSVRYDLQAMASENVALDDPITIRLSAADLKMRDMLALVLQPLYLDFTTDGEHLLITSVHMQGIETRAYDVRHFAKTPRALELVAKFITTKTWPHNWSNDGGPGRIYFHATADDSKRVLIISHSAEAHEDIAREFARWRSSRDAETDIAPFSCFVSGLR